MGRKVRPLVPDAVNPNNMGWLARVWNEVRCRKQ
jgi:hypothetical protein